MKEKYLEMFNNNVEELHLKFPQHSVEIKFTAQQLQSIKVAQANMNTALEQLKTYCTEKELAPYVSTARNCDNFVKVVLDANKNNDDRFNYLLKQNSPDRSQYATNRFGKKIPKPPEFPSLKSITKSSNAPTITPSLALYALQQQKQQQQDMDKVLKQMGEMSISGENSQVAGLAVSIDGMKFV